MTAALLPVSQSYLSERLILDPNRSRLHRLVARMFDTYIDDLTDDRIEEIERLVDTFRITHADGTRINRTPSKW